MGGRFTYMCKEVIKNVFTFIFIKEILMLIFYYILNHVKGLRKVNKGKNVRIRPGVLLRDAERIYLGDNTMLNHGNILWAGKKNAIITLGSNVIVGPYVQIIAFNHGFSKIDEPILEQEYTEENIIVGDDVWIGAGAILVAGAKVGNGSIIAAGSVVTGEIPAYSVCAGIPAKVIKTRK